MNIEQKVIIFDTTKGFFSSTADVEKLNIFITELNQDGWRVVGMSNDGDPQGSSSYRVLLLVERGSQS